MRIQRGRALADRDAPLPFDPAMTSPRNILLIALLFISYLLWMQWQDDYNRAPVQTAASPTAPTSIAAPPGSPPNTDIPASSATTAVAPTLDIASPAPTQTQAPPA